MATICGKCKKQFDPNGNNDPRCPSCYKDKPLLTLLDMIPPELKEEWKGKRKEHFKN